MCGIGGIVALTSRVPTPAREALARMAGAMRHRGPDEFGIYRDQRVGLAHARLSIIDITSGQQPMADVQNETCIVFNGEIYNYLEIRAELLAAGVQFHTRSDTEVVLQAWKHWGHAAFDRMNGQWAVAIWSRTQRCLVLARDPIGICPLHYCEHDGALYFASEVKAIFAANGTITRALDPQGLQQTLTFWSPVPPVSAFVGVRELEPGHVRTYHLSLTDDPAELTVQDHALNCLLASCSPQPTFKGSFDDAVHAVRHALKDATRLRILRSDVPVGSYLSGGIDSSMVAAMGQQLVQGKIKTFSLGFDDAEFDEVPFQRQMAERIGSEHHCVMVSKKAIADVFPDVIWHAERPLLRTAPAPLFLLSRLVNACGVKVVLTGEGADEMFAGYDLFRESKVRRFWGKQPNSAWRHRLLERLYPYLSRSPVAQQAMTRQFFGRDRHLHQQAGFGHGPRWHTTAALQRLFSPDAAASAAQHDPVAALLCNLPAHFDGWDGLAQDQYIEIRTLLAGYLMSSQGDRMLLGHSVEGRFPFLDKDVVALAHSLPPAYKLKVLNEKHVVKQAAEGLVPDSIRFRKKQPYRAPDAVCFVGPDAPPYVAEVLSDAALKRANVFDVKACRQLLAKCTQRAAEGVFSNADNMALVGVLSVQLLHQKFVVDDPVATLPVVFKTDIDNVSK